MRIEQVKLYNFRIYKGEVEIIFNQKGNNNICLIAGKNGFGKTTFLTSLIWAFYGNLMSQVEDKYKTDIKNAGGYDKYRKTLINKTVFNEANENKYNNDLVEVEIHLVDVLIPSIPCKKVIIRRTYDLQSKKETLRILIDGHENELTKEIGYEVFINDFILPREIAKFFFFDSEKIVSLAEAKTSTELKTLSKAYSEVLGIKKYEDLKLSLNALLTKLRRRGISKIEKSKLDELVSIETDLTNLIQLNTEQQETINEQIVQIKNRTDEIQEKLIREGNDITLEELNTLIQDKKHTQAEIDQLKNELKKLYEILPVVIGGNALKKFINQLNTETDHQSKQLNQTALIEELNTFTSSLLKEIHIKKLDAKIQAKIEKAAQQIIANKTKINHKTIDPILLDYDEETSRSILATYQYIKDSFKIHFQTLVKKEKDLRLNFTRISNKIKQAELKKSNPYAKELNLEKGELNTQLFALTEKKEQLIVEQTELKIKFTSNQKVLSEYEKNFKLVATDQKKYKVTEELLVKISELTKKIKEEKKYALEKAIHAGLKQLMHKDQFVNKIEVRIENEIMDIDLFDTNQQLINKESLSKGEQQLYATALLKALVDESGINFPVFIDSPLQKFDKEHSNNIIKQFYPNISGQVVLFPLLEKELTETEYDLLKPNLSGVYLIENNNEGSTVNPYNIDELFTQFNTQQHVYSN